MTLGASSNQTSSGTTYNDIFPLLLELTSQAVIQIDSNGIIRLWNASAETIFGYDASEACGSKLSELIGFEEALWRPLLEQSSLCRVSMSIRARGRNAKVVDLQIRSAPVRDNPRQSPSLLLVCEDQSDRITAESLADNVRRQQQAVLNNIPDIAWLKDRESRYVVVNEPFAAACGKTVDELIGLDDTDAFPTDLAEKYRADDKRVISSGKRMIVEEPIIFSDGSELRIETIKTPIIDADGHVIGTAGIARDVTERARAVKELQDREALYRTLFDSSVAAFALLRDQRVIDCNERFCWLFNIDHEVVSGMTLSELSPRGQEDGKDSETSLEVRIAACKHGTSQFFCWTFQPKESAAIEAEVGMKPIYLQDETLVLVEIRDITARRQAETRVQDQLRFLQLLIDSIPTPIFYKDPSGAIAGCNLSFAQGFNKQRNEILGKTAEDLLPASEANLINEIDKLVKQYGKPYRVECALTYTGGTRHDVVLSQAAFYKADGAVGGIVGSILDISDLKSAERRLIEGEERFRLAIAHAGMIVSHQNSQLEYEWIYHPKQEREDQYLPERAPEQEAIAEDLETVIALKRRVLANGIGERIEFRTITENEKHHFDLIVEPRKDENDLVVGLTNVAVDITPRKQVERSLQERHRLLTALMTNLPGMIYRCRNDAGRSLEFASDGCTALTGYSSAELIEKRSVVFSNLIHPDDREWTNNSLRSALARGEQYELTYRIITATGQEKWVWDHGWAEEATINGHCIVQGLILDITHQKHEDERRIKLTAAVEQAEEAIMITDTNGIIEYVNPAFLKVSGYSLEEIIGQRPNFQSSGQHSEAFYQNLWDTILRGEVWNGHLINRRKDGTLIEEDASIRVVRDSQGKIMNFIAVKRDVTKLVALETQLRQAQKLEAVGSLAAGIAHEINTPIQFVGDNTHFLSDSFSELLRLLDIASELAKCPEPAEFPAPLREFITEVKNSDLDYLRVEIPKSIEQSLQGIERVANIVRAMKDFSHPDKKEKTAVDINRALQTTLTVARNELKYVADVVEELTPNLPALLCYPSELNQVFLNLLVNAAHAIADVVSGTKNRGKITVRSAVDGNDIVVSISDTGIGIEPGVQDRVFEPFFTTKDVGKGTGQGLAIARSVVVEKHGGSIYFESERNVGTTFFVRLPVEKQGGVLK